MKIWKAAYCDMCLAFPLSPFHWNTTFWKLAVPSSIWRYITELQNVLFGAQWVNLVSVLTTTSVVVWVYKL